LTLIMTELFTFTDCPYFPQIFKSKYALRIHVENLRFCKE
jgi:hypothetical protein